MTEVGQGQILKIPVLVPFQTLTSPLHSKRRRSGYKNKFSSVSYGCEK